MQFSTVETSGEETRINKSLTEWERRRNLKEPLRRNFQNSVPPYYFNPLSASVARI